MFRLDPKPDILQERAIRRRQRLETERKERILDPKSRTLGIDVNALEEQIKMKNELKASEKEKNQNFDRITMETNQLLQILDQKVAEARKQNERALVEYRRQHQHTHAQREIDLNDLCSLKKTNLINLNCDDGSLKFEGEDETEGERLRLQKEQMRLWTIQKIQEKEQRITQEKEEERQRVEYNKAIAAKIHELTRAEERNRKSVAMSDREFNARLAAEKKLREALAKKQDLEEKTKEIQALMNGSLLAERSASLPQHSTDRGKTLTDSSDGKPLNGIHEVQQVRNYQLSEKETRKMREEEEAKSWAAQEFWNNRSANLLVREKDRQKKEAAKKLMLDNLKQAQEFKERQHYINRTVYTNKPADEYFAQFNTTSR